MSCSGSGNSEGTTPPVRVPVVAVSPDNLSVDVARETELWVRFSEQLDPNSLTRDAVIANDGHGDVRGTLAYDPVTLTLRCVPERLLARDTVVIVTLSGTLRTATQRVFGSSLTWSFTTRPGVWSKEAVLGECAADQALDIAMNGEGAAAVGYGDSVHLAAPAQTWGPAWHIPNPAGTASVHDLRVLPSGSVLVGWSAGEGTQRVSRLTELDEIGNWSTSTITSVESALWRGTTFFTSTSGHVLARIAVDKNPLPWSDLHGFWSAAGPAGPRKWLPTNLLWYWRAGWDLVCVDDIGGFVRYSSGAQNTPALLGYFDLRSGMQSYAAPKQGPLTVFLTDEGTVEVLELGPLRGSSYPLAVRGERFNQAYFEPIVSEFELPRDQRSWLAACASNGDIAVVFEIKIDEGNSKLVGLGFSADERRWTAVQELSPREPFLPAPRKFVLAMGPHGDGWLVFARQGSPASGDPLVGFRYRAKRGFGPERQLATIGAAGLRSHALALDAEGRACVAWLDFVTPPIATPKVRVIRSE